MLKILVNSYTCCPNMGSEQGMGWNWITSLAKTGDVELFVISEGEYRTQCEEGLSITLPGKEGTDGTEEAEPSERWKKNIHFYWNPVPQSTRDKCWNQGNWSFYPLYEKWQKKTAEIARDICKEHKIDILHQLNMIGFREPGYLWQVSKETGIPFVWGPIGGLKQFPVAYADEGGLKIQAFARLKNVINIWQIKHDRRVNAALRQASLLISSIPDSYNAIKKYKGLESVVIPETGCLEKSKLKKQKSKINKDSVIEILWVGKFDFRKRLDIALRTIALLKDKDVMMKVYGTGNEQQISNAHELTKTLGIEKKIQYMGARPNSEVTEAMRNADVFFFTSVNEDTSTVVLEAVSNHLPVVCFDCCGMAAVIDDKVGRKVQLTNPKQSVEDFAGIIRELCDNTEQLAEMSANCARCADELSWSNKAKKMIGLYEMALGAK